MWDMRDVCLRCDSPLTKRLLTPHLSSLSPLTSPGISHAQLSVPAFFFFLICCCHSTLWLPEMWARFQFIQTPRCRGVPALNVTETPFWGSHWWSQQCSRSRPFSGLFVFSHCAYLYGLMLISVGKTPELNERESPVRGRKLLGSFYFSKRRTSLTRIT